METFLGFSGKKGFAVGSTGNNFPECRERRLKLLEERKCRYKESEHCEFTADEALIGLIIGKQGEKLTRVAREHKVEIRVLPDDGGVRRVRIYGPNKTSVDQARNVLEYVYQEYRVPEEMVGLILGKKGGSIKDISQKAGLHSAWFDDSNRVVLLCGLRHTVDQAVNLLNSHAQTFRVPIQNSHSAGASFPASGEFEHPTPLSGKQIVGETSGNIMLHIEGLLRNSEQNNQRSNILFS